MIIDKVQARELGEAIIDAAEAVEARKQDQHIVMVGDKAVAIPYHPAYADEYESIAIIKYWRASNFPKKNPPIPKYRGA